MHKETFKGNSKGIMKIIRNHWGIFSEDEIDILRDYHEMRERKIREYYRNRKNFYQREILSN